MLNVWPRSAGLGARLVLQRAVRGGGDRLPGAGTLRADDGCTRLSEREPAAEGADGRGRAGDPDAAGSRTAEWFVSSVRPNGRRAARTRLLEALVIWGWVRSCWTAESLVSEAARGSPRAPPARSAGSCERAIRPSGRGAWARPAGRPVLGRHLPAHQAHRCQGGRAGGLGLMTRPGSECCWMRCWARGNDTGAGDGPRPSRRGLRAPMLVVTDRCAGSGPGDRGAVAGPRSPAVYRAPTLKPGCQAAKEGCPAAPAGGGGLLGSAG
jgi:hypothetical protein